MPILTKNETPTKGQKAEFQLDKAALAILPFVAADAYFSDMTNWKQVELVYVSPIGRQRKVVKFDATQTTPVGDFFASVKAQNNFEIQYIMINDFDGGELKIPRIEFESGEFDVEFASAPVTALITGDFASGLPAGWYNGGATITEGLAKFDNTYAQLLFNISGPYSIVPDQTYTARLYIDSAPTTSSNQQILVNLFGGSNVVFSYSVVAPHIGGYVDLPITAGSTATGWELGMNGINCYSGNEINISKIEILEV